MSGTVRSINFMLTSQAQDGQAVGSYTLSRQRDFMATLGARTGNIYGAIVRVTDPEFGADPTGAGDSTTAFQNAMAAGVPCMVPPLQANGTRAIYRLANCVVPSGAQLFGMHSMSYGGGGGDFKGGTTGGFLPAVICPVSSSTTRIFNIDGKLGVSFNGLVIDCSNVSGFVGGESTQVCDGISAGEQTVNLENCSIYFAKNGLGGAVAGSSTTFPSSQWISTIRNCCFMNCVTGITGLVDSQIVGGFFTGCRTGMYFDANSSAVNIFGARVEWCGRVTTDAPTWTTGSYGIFCDIGGLLNIQSCYLDTNGIAGIYFNQAYMCSVGNCYFQANGTNATTSAGTTLVSDSSHIKFNSAFNITITGCTSRGDVATDNPNKIIYGPAAFANFAGTSGAITMTGNDMSGYQGNTTGAAKTAPQNSSTTWHSGAQTLPASNHTGDGLSAFIIKNNLGTGAATNDIDSR